MGFSAHFMPLMIDSGASITFYRTIQLPEDFYPDLPLLFRHILYRRKRNMTTIIVVVGGVRTGKTYFCLKAIETLMGVEKKQFNVRDQVFFDALPFFKFMRHQTDAYCLLEEVGVGYNSQDWFTVQNKIFKNILQTQGFRRNVIFMTLPNVAYLLKSARFLLNFGIETVETGRVSVNKVVVKHLLGKGWLEYIENINFGLPSKDIVNDYELMKKEWNDKNLDQDIAKIERIENPPEAKDMEYDKELVKRDETPEWDRPTL